jgi:hypothetical protein
MCEPIRAPRIPGDGTTSTVVAELSGPAHRAAGRIRRVRSNADHCGQFHRQGRRRVAGASRRALGRRVCARARSRRVREAPLTVQMASGQAVTSASERFAQYPVRPVMVSASVQPFRRSRRRRWHCANRLRPARARSSVRRPGLRRALFPLRSAGGSGRLPRAGLRGET